VGFASGAASIIRSSSTGAFGGGYAYSGGAIYAGSEDIFGCFAFGSADGADSAVSANGHGAVSFGRAASGGSVASLNSGSFAAGYALLVGSITASGEGSAAFGYASGGNVQAGGQGALAIGSSVAGYDISASGEGSVAVGVPLIADITASGINSFAHGDGSLAEGDFSFVHSRDGFAQLVGQYAHAKRRHNYVGETGANTTRGQIQFERFLMSHRCENTTAFEEVVLPTTYDLNLGGDYVACYQINLTFVAVSTASGAAKTFKRACSVICNATGANLIGTVDTVGSDKSTGASIDGADVQITTDGTTQKVKIEVKGVSGAYVYWSVCIEAVRNGTQHIGPGGG
jgi:hypothetical protein